MKIVRNHYLTQLNTNVCKNPFQLALLEQPLFGFIELKKHLIKDIEIYWENYHIIAKNSAQFILISFCTSNRVLSLLRITQNVVLSHLLEDKKFMKLVKKHAAEKSVVLRKGKLDESEINLISKLQ